MSIEGIKSYYHVNETKFHALTEEECEKIILAALRIMEETGLVIQKNTVGDIFEKAGCTVEGDLVKFPQELVKECIASAAPELVLYDRMGNDVIHATGCNNYYGNGPTNPMYNDFETGERRLALTKDIANNALVSDACPNIDFIMGLGGISDCDPQVADIVELQQILKNTTKPIIPWCIDVENLKDLIEMCSAVAGGGDKLAEKPFVAIFPGCSITPLTTDGLNYEKMKYAIEAGLPIICMTGPQLGCTAPVTLAGAIALGMAEVFVSLVFSQLVKKGSAIALGVVIVSTDMATTSNAYGTPEHCIGDAAVADIFHYLNLPMIQTGGVTESKIVDEQAAIESSMQIISNALVGGHLVHDVGFIDAAMSASLDQIVMCDEIISYARRFARGFEVNDETLAIDVIQEVGPGGEYLTQDHTFMHFRDELWKPITIDRSKYDTWAVDAKDMRTRVHERTKKLLEEHQVAPLPEDVVSTIDEIVARAEKRVKK